MQKYQKQIAVVVLMLVFSSLFIRNLKSDLPLIFEKQLHGHDEASNSVVSANITRQFFPPMVRVNPLNEQQGNWMEGPYWQHIPPLFAYVPYIFFQLDGEVTIEIKRLAYAFLILLTGWIFIFGIYLFRKSLATALTATIATIFWINTPFTHELITGYAFGASDIVLAFTVVGALVAILWYLHKEREERVHYQNWQLAVIGLTIALPIMTKNLLGAIPAATFFALLFWDFRRLNKKIIFALSWFLGALSLYYVSLYVSSPDTFKREILVSFFHFGNLEGWGRPWHYYVTNYLPQRYLFGWTWVYFLGLILSLGVSIKYKVLRDRRDQVLLALSGGWFLWNLLATSLVESKIPNFIYQSYLLSLFFIVHSIVALLSFPRKRESSVGLFSGSPIKSGMTVSALVILIGIITRQAISFVQHFRYERTKAYNYQTEFEKFYQAAEELKRMGLNTKDLVIIRVSDNDCWFRYPILFLTGAEPKTLLEMNFLSDPYAKIKDQYRRMYFLLSKQDGLQKLGNYSYIEFDLDKMDASQVQIAIQAFLDIHKDDIAQDILRIKKDKTSCQWLVPDPILNAP